MTVQTVRQWVFSVARQWRKSSAPLVNPPYRVNPAAQSAPLRLCQWRSRSKLGLTPMRADIAHPSFISEEKQ